MIAAVASLLRGKQYIHELHSQSAQAATEAAPAPAMAGAASPLAEAATRARVAIAEEIQESPERIAGSPEPATRFRKDR